MPKSKKWEERYYVLRKRGKDWVGTRWDYGRTQKEAKEMVKRWGLKRGQYRILKRLAP